MPTNPFEIPLQLGNVSWYPGVENTASTETALTTGRQTMTAYELVAEVPWSLTLDEDAVIAMAGEVRSTLVRNAVEVIDDVLLNADTTTTNNINADGATISASTAGKAHWLVGFDGLAHLPLVDNTGQGNNHSAGANADMFNEARGLLGKYGVRPSELAYIADVGTYIKSLGIDAVSDAGQAGAAGDAAERATGAGGRDSGDSVGAAGGVGCGREGYGRGQREQQGSAADCEPDAVAAGVSPGADD